MINPNNININRNPNIPTIGLGQLPPLNPQNMMMMPPPPMRNNLPQAPPGLRPMGMPPMLGAPPMMPMMPMMPIMPANTGMRFVPPPPLPNLHQPNIGLLNQQILNPSPFVIINQNK